MKIRLALLPIAILAAVLLPLTSHGVMIEVNGSRGRSADNFQSSNLGTFNSSNVLGDIQSWLDQPSSQDLIRNVGSHVDDAALANVITQLENSNFQLDSNVAGDFTSWLQNHHFEFNSNCVADFSSWMCNEERDWNCGHFDNGHDCDRSPHGPTCDRTPHNPTPVPEPSSLLLIAAAGIGAAVYRAVRSAK